MMKRNFKILIGSIVVVSTCFMPFRIPISLISKYTEKIGNTGTVEHTDKIGNTSTVEHTAKIGNTGTVEHTAKIGNTGTVEHAAKIGNTSTVEHTEKIGNTGTVEHTDKIENTSTVEHTAKIGNTGTVEHTKKIGKKNWKLWYDKHTAKTAVGGAAICAIQKDALPYIDEWVDYHHSIGFETIFVYDNSPDFELADWYNNRLRRTNDTDYIEIEHLPGNRQQVHAYRHCKYRISALNSHAWIAFIDLDEFFVIQDRQKYPRIMDLLDTLPANAGALGVNWYMVGYCNQTIYEPKPVTLRFQRRQPGINPHIKSIVRVSNHPVHVDVHYAKFKDPSKFKTMDTSGAIIEGPFNENGPTDKIVIYHYYAKSLEEFKARCNRGRADVPTTNKKEYPPCIEGIDYLVEHFGESKTIFDDTPWKILKENIPAYSKFESDVNATN